VPSTRSIRHHLRWPAWSEKKNIEKRTPGGRLATTDDVVGAVDFLLTNRGVNGINLVIDGGWLLT
jgi:NAD(P)-dependent dehydrogenase (short-subunit alcohol dehydrogenase family)